MPVQSNNWEKYIEENNTVAINKPYNGTQGMFIPYYLKDKITSFSDLANPAIASMFDKDILLQYHLVQIQFVYL